MVIAMIIVTMVGVLGVGYLYIGKQREGHWSQAEAGDIWMEHSEPVIWTVQGSRGAAAPRNWNCWDHFTPWRQSHGSQFVAKQQVHSSLLSNRSLTVHVIINSANFNWLLNRLLVKNFNRLVYFFSILCMSFCQCFWLLCFSYSVEKASEITFVYLWLWPFYTGSGYCKELWVTVPFVNLKFGHRLFKIASWCMCQNQRR